MRLRQLKLVGFKSFVDTVTIPLPSQLVAVVGPNGCGKSNVIDAVRWVMGESHAKQLRGEAMTDVIFKGSSNRKSIGQASVELIFDNSLGKLSGPYAQYQEIAVKRSVTRDGESTYYLNGTRCRRRDITDIFLGTGVGARGYSVIGQDTISRLIEARPEELRAYLEEAAGVSKYKERRRETMQRMTQTRENLARVADIQAELTKQLTKLERQANTAKQYKQYQQEAHAHRFAVHALKWHALDSEQQQCIKTQQQIQEQYDLHQTQLATHVKTHAEQQLKLQEMLAYQQENQAAFYQHKSELVRLEESIQQQKQRYQQQQLDAQQVKQEEKQLQQQIQTDQETLAVSQQQLQILLTTMAMTEEKREQANQDVQHIEKIEMDWRSVSQTLMAELNEVTQAHQIKALQKEHQQTREAKLKLQYENHQQSLFALNEEHLTEEMHQAKSTREAASAAYQDLQTQNQSLLDNMNVCRQQLLDMEKQLQIASDTLRPLAEEHAALQAAQASALKSSAPKISTSTQSRIVEHMQVEDQWRPMIERVMGESLEAVVTDDITGLHANLETIKGQASLFSQPWLSTQSTSYPCLADKIKGLVPQWPINIWQIFAADSLAQALTWLATLSADQSIVTVDGFWLGLGWVRVFDLNPTDDVGVLSRQHALSQLVERIQIQTTRRQDCLTQRDQYHQHLTTLQQQQHIVQTALANASETLRLSELAYEQKQQIQKNAVTQKAIWQTDCETILVELEDVMVALHDLTTELTLLAEKRTTLLEKQATHQQNKSQFESALQTAKHALQQLLTESQTLMRQHSQEDAKQYHLQQQIDRAQQQFAHIEQRQSQLKMQMEALAESLRTLQSELADKLAVHEQREADVMMWQQAVESQQQCLQKTDQLCKYEEKQANDLQQQLQQLHVTEQTLAARATAHVDRLGEMREDWQIHLTTLAEGLTIAQSEAALSRIEANMARLGPINLLAIEEYEADLQRKTHLDTQAHDLTEALMTLERAIAKMDQETQQRFKETFDQVNQGFQTLFPRLFGGGHATLEMTCDNLLEAGVLVMAQPPGKRNNTIYMLSGGEKAMTAVALVFAIFQLNPSPFCMLDEVDAPLDEANVRRFCELVREMSQVVQFLLITHNKVTMEIAEHLIGVTMREPGVSRIVSVDLTTMI